MELVIIVSRVENDDHVDAETQIDEQVDQEHGQVLLNAAEGYVVGGQYARDQQNQRDVQVPVLFYRVLRVDNELDLVDTVHHAHYLGLLAILHSDELGEL